VGGGLPFFEKKKHRAKSNKTLSRSGEKNKEHFTTANRLKEEEAPVDIKRRQRRVPSMRKHKAPLETPRGKHSAEKGTNCGENQLVEQAINSKKKQWEMPTSIGFGGGVGRSKRKS